jgi:hypothetical protein
MDREDRKVLQRQTESGKPEVLPFMASLELLLVVLQKKMNIILNRKSGL